MYSNKVRQAIESANANYSKLMDIATNTQQTEQPQEEAIKNKWLLAEGFRPVMTPEKEVKWVPKPQHPTDAIQPYQKSLTAMSNETMVEAYPMMQHAIKNYWPVVEHLAGEVKNGNMSLQKMIETILKLTYEGTSEAIKATGGMSKQGAMQIAKAANPADAAMILSSSPKAIGQLGGSDGD